MPSLAATLCVPVLLVQVPADEAVLRPLVVNGRAISADEIRRHALYVATKPVLDARLRELMVEQELYWQAREEVVAESKLPNSERSEGSIASDALQRSRARLAKLRPTDERVHAEMSREADAYRRANPTLGRKVWLRVHYRTSDWAMDAVRSALLFDDVFLPNDPAEWPATTVEAVIEDDGPAVVEEAEADYRQRKVWAEQHAAPFPRNDFQFEFLRTSVARHIRSRWTVRTAADGLEAQVLLAVEGGVSGEPGLQISTREAWSRFAPEIDACEIEDARRWLAASTALRDRLHEDGAAVEACGCDEARRKLLDTLVDTHVDEETVAELRGFPSFAAFRAYFCAMHAFETLVARERAKNPPGPLAARVGALRERVAEPNAFGIFDVDVLLVGAYDIPSARWLADGWAGASTRARALKNELDASAREDSRSERSGGTRSAILPRIDDLWRARMEAMSGIHDVPRPKPRFPSATAPFDEGQFRSVYRVDLAARLRETVYTQLLNGASIADHVFFEQSIGAIDGPFRGPHGYYFTRLKKRVPATHPVDVSAERMSRVLDHEALRLAFLEYARDALAHAEVEGL